VLAEYITKLLLEYDCVIIPNLGGFVGNYSGAKIHPTQHSFEPPHKQLAFNKNLTTNDGLLANAIATEKSISFAAANSLIDEEVRRIEIKLAKKEKVELAGIGTLYFDVERNLQFKADNSINFLLDSFGLSSFQSPAIKRENFTERFEKQFIDRPALPYPDKAKSKRKVWPVLLAIPVLLIIVLVPLKNNLLGKLSPTYSSLNFFSNSEVPKYKERLETFEFQLPIEKSVSSLLTSSNEAFVSISLTGDNSKMIPVKMEIAVADTSFVKPPQAALREDIPMASYYLIAGCFKQLENAEALLNELKAKGFDACLAGQNASGLYRVSYYKFKDKTSAEAAKAELKLENKETWLFQN
jgi:CCDC81-like prokaryotic HU domain 1/CCDC81-like prokaryotic HU domain 2/SPOR domain